MEKTLPANKFKFKPNFLNIYLFCISASGLGLFLWASTQPCPCWPSLFLFIGLIIIAELTPSEAMATQMAFSSSAAVSFATLLLFGPAPAALVGMMGGITTTIVTGLQQKQDDQETPGSRASLLKRLFFNMATYGWSIFVAGQVYFLVGGQLGEIATWSNLWPLALAALANELVNAATVIGVVSLQIKQSPFKVWKQNVSWAEPINLVTMALGGVGLALGYQIAGILGIAVFFLPSMLSIYAFRLYVGQTKAQMDHLETIIADRTHELRQANDSLQELNENRLAFFSMINHELRTPLNGILGYTQLLKRDFTLASQHQKTIGIMHQSGEHLLSLINKILDLSKIEVGRMEVQLSDFHFEPFLQNIINICQVRADEKGLKFTYDFALDQIKHVQGDEQHLRQVLINLINNAIKYTLEGSVIFKVYQHNDKIRFQIEDTGIGISAEDIARIFTPFRRAKNRHHQIEGTGLGLAISKGLVEVMGSQLQVESTPEKGSTFWFDLTLPIVDASVETAPFVEATIIGIDGPPQKALIVDDNAENRTLLVNMLASVGFETTEAENGQVALAKAIAVQPTLILMDLAMPVMDGFETTRQLRQIPHLKDSTIIAVSAFTTAKDQKRSLEAGCNAFVAKPVKLDLILQTIQEFLDITWLYQQPNASLNRVETSTDRPSRYIAPSLEIVTQLHHSALKGDVQALTQQAIALKEQDNSLTPFVDELIQLASRYRMRQIRQFLTLYLTDKTT